MCGLVAVMRAIDRSPHAAFAVESSRLAVDRSLPEPAIARLEPEEYLGSVVAIQFSPDGRYLAAGVRKPNPKYEWPAPEGVCVWDLKSRTFVRYMPDLEPQEFAFSPDSSTLAVCRNMSRSGNDPCPERMLLVDVATGQQLRHYDFAWQLIFLQFSQDGERLYYSLAGPVHLYVLDLKPGTVSPAYPELTPPPGRRRLAPFSIDFCQRNQTVACTLYGGGSCLFQPGVQKPAVVLPAVVPESSHVRLSPDGQLLATMAEHRPARLFVDSLPDVQQHILPADRLSDFVTALVYALRTAGVTSLFAAELDALVGLELRLPIPEISASMDNGILLRHFELASRLYRLVSVIKMRQSTADPAIREYVITDQGIAVGEPFTHATALLTGSAVPVGTQSPPA